MANWFRSWHGAPTDIKWISVARDAGTTPAHVIAVVWALLDHASQESDRGDIHNFKPRDFAAFSGIDEAEIERILSALLRNGVTENSRFAAWEKRQPNAEDRTNAERQRRFRQRKAVENKQKSETKESVTALRNGCNDRVEESREDKKELSNDSSKKAKRGSRLAENWVATPGNISFAQGEGLTFEEAHREAFKFRDYWLSIPGQKGVKLDWDRTWQNWIRRAAERKAGHGKSRAGEGSDFSNAFDVSAKG